MSHAIYYIYAKHIRKGCLTLYIGAKHISGRVMYVDILLADLISQLCVYLQRGVVPSSLSFSQDILRIEYLVKTQRMSSFMVVQK